MATSFNEASFEKKISSVTNTQDGIQTLSLWMIHHKIHYKKIVNIWLKALKNAKLSHRLTLFNLANDVIQNSRRKGFPNYVDAFGEVLKEATPLVRDDKILQSIQRIYKIWEERDVYSSESISELIDLLEDNQSAKLVADFKINTLVDQLRKTSKLDLDVKTKLQIMNNLKVDASNLETLSALKDRSMGQQFSCDFEEATHCLEEYVGIFSNAVQQRKNLLEVLEEAVLYYDSQRTEAKIVANAYKNFGGRIKNLRKKLEEKIKQMPSPVASPNPNAPSPSPSETAEDLFSEHDDKGKESPPSPEGTPEEFRFSPGDHSFEKESTSTAVAASVEKNVSPVNDGDNTSSFLPEVKNLGDSSVSLDSRLTNLMENMQTLPPSVFSTLFGKSSSNSPSDEQKIENSPIISGTPLSDEPTGRETPLQDETGNVPRAVESELPGDIPTYKPISQGTALSNLVHNNDQNWNPAGNTPNWPSGADPSYPEPNGYPWNATGVATAYHDKDERVLSGADVEPMDMELDDEEAEAASAIVESNDKRDSMKSDMQLNEKSVSSNLITVVDTKATSNDNVPSDDTTNVLDSNEKHSESLPVKDTEHNKSTESELDLLQDTQRLIEQQLSANISDHKSDDIKISHKYAHQSERNDYMNTVPRQVPMDNQYYQPRPQNNYGMYHNSGNNWRNNFNNMPRRPYRPRHMMPNSRPYRLTPPPRWRY